MAMTAQSVASVDDFTKAREALEVLFLRVTEAGATSHVTLGAMITEGVARVSALIAEERANIVAIEHDRAFSHWVAIGETEVELTLETFGRSHVESLKLRLESSGYRVEERV